MWRRYAGCVIGFVTGAALAWLIGFEDKVVALAGFGVAAVMMTFGERWGLVPSADEADKPQTLFSHDPDKPVSRDTSGYLDAIDYKEELKDDLWERFGSLTYDRGRKQKKRRVSTKPKSRG